MCLKSVDFKIGTIKDGGFEIKSLGCSIQMSSFFDFFNQVVLIFRIFELKI
jgi:hypothetical protein